MKRKSFGLTAAFLLASLAALAADTLLPKPLPWDAPHNANPFIPGYYADASILQTKQETYLYATEDPWGQRTLGCWHSADLQHWRTCTLNWPTKEAATSPTSKDSMVWAPSVVRAPNGRFYMYVSVGSEIWVGVANTPLGPWRNALGNKPLISADYNRAFHMIDAEAFIDTDGQAYLYWGSGLHWINGHCFAVRLKPDMVTFDGEPRDVTPPHYFEGPFMYKRAGKYYLMYSQGKTTDATYNVRYAVGDSPFGPFREGASSPLLKSDPANNILGPGHHAMFDRGGKTYIVYHRHSIPFDPNTINRQLCMDQIKFSDDGEMHVYAMPHQGPILLHRTRRDQGSFQAEATASSTLDALHSAARATDDNYATRWAPAPTDTAPWLQLYLGKTRKPTRTEMRLEYPWKTYRFRLATSIDGEHWTNTARTATTGSPITYTRLPPCRYLRLTFAAQQPSPSVFEWTVF